MDGRELPLACGCDIPEGWKPYDIKSILENRKDSSGGDQNTVKIKNQKTALALCDKLQGGFLILSGNIRQKIFTPFPEDYSLDKAPG